MSYLVTCRAKNFEQPLTRQYNTFAAALGCIKKALDMRAFESNEGVVMRLGPGCVLAAHPVEGGAPPVQPTYYVAVSNKDLSLTFPFRTEQDADAAIFKGATSGVFSVELSADSGTFVWVEDGTCFLKLTEEDYRKIQGEAAREAAGAEPEKKLLLM